MTGQQADELLEAAHAVSDILIHNACMGTRLAPATLDWLGVRLQEAVRNAGREDAGRVA